MQRVFLIHGWGGSPNNDWMPWAKKALEEKGFKVYVPEMPDTMHPKIGAWVGKLAEEVGEVHADDVLIGHSIGCLTVLRFLETLIDDEKVRKLILVAPWQYLTLDEEEDPAVAEPWIKTPIDYGKIKSKVDTITTVFSDNDPWVPYQKNLEFFKEKLDPEIVTKHGMGHFNEGEGITELPFLLELVK
jgi:predicted alpha/beta hydrolase family esterase